MTTIPVSALLADCVNGAIAILSIEVQFEPEPEPEGWLTLVSGIGLLGSFSALFRRDQIGSAFGAR